MHENVNLSKEKFLQQKKMTRTKIENNVHEVTAIHVPNLNNSEDSIEK